MFELDPNSPFDLEKVSFTDDSREAILQIDRRGRKLKLLKNLKRSNS